MGSATVSSGSVTDLTQFKVFHHDLYLSGKAGSGAAFIKAVIVRKDGFSIPYLYAFHCTDGESPGNPRELVQAYFLRLGLTGYEDGWQQI